MTKRLYLLLTLLAWLTGSAMAQMRNDGTMSSNGNMRSGQGENGRFGAQKDSLNSGHKVIPKRVYMWTVDKRFGDMTRQPMDTVTHMFQNSVVTEGLRGEYNFLGNLGTPRINRIFINRLTEDGDFLFAQPYDFFRVRPEDFLFTNTLSPYANLSYNTCGNRTNGEDSFAAKFAVNAGKRFGMGFKINYLYGRGYYSDQSTSLLNANLYGSYTGDQYQAHLLFSTNNQKISENGGITDDMFITHPESFDDNFATNEIPTMLNRNWNRNKDQHIFLTHRYNIGYNRKVRMSDEEIEARKFAIESQKDMQKEKNRRNGIEEDEETDSKRPAAMGRPENAIVAGNDKQLNDSTVAIDSTRQVMSVAMADSLARVQTKKKEEEQWMKREFVPVTSFIHTLQFDNHDRIYQAYTSPAEYYANNYYEKNVIGGDSIYDNTKHFRLRNTVAFSMLEGFNKWIFAGIKAFAASDLRHYALPNEEGQLTNHNNHNLSVGAQLSRTQGHTLHYKATAETWLLGDEQGQVKIDASADLNFALFGDTLTLAANGFFHNERANYYLRHYHSRHFWWDDDLSMSTHTHLEGTLAYAKTKTAIRVGVDELTNYTYLGETFETNSAGLRTRHNIGVKQSDEAITMLTASLSQNFTLGPVNWENVVTYQKSTKQEVLPVPTLNIYTNLYLKFRIAKVLSTELGADARFFTEYAAPDYSPALGQFVVQENTEKVKIGNYPIINAYANFNLKGTRFFVMYTHANCGMGNSKYFLTPHYPLNKSVLRLGLSWNFFN